MGRSSHPYLYRIVSFDRLVQALESNELYFAHPSSWEDPYETQLQHKDSARVFGLCWCRTGVSDAMWRIYSTNRLGVRIRTTRHRLKEALTAVTQERSIKWKVQDVRYLRSEDLRHELECVADLLWQRNSVHDMFAPLFVKREAFRHEDEVRAVVLAPPEIDHAVRGAFRLKVQMRWLIDNVLIDPRAPDEFVDAYRHYLKDRLEFPGYVGKSALYAKSDVIEAGPET